MARKRHARERQAWLARALPLTAVAASLSLAAADASGLLARLDPTPLGLAIASGAIALVASAALALVLARGDRSLGAVAAEADRRLGLSDRAAAALGVLESGPPRPDSMPALVVRDAAQRWPDDAARRLFPRANLLGPLAWVAVACLLPLALASFRREARDEGVAEPATANASPSPPGAGAPPLRFLAIVPDEGMPGSDVSIVVDGELPGTLMVRFGTRDVPVRAVKTDGVARLVATVPSDLTPGVIPVVARQGRRRSGALAFRVVDVPLGGGAGEEPGENPETPDPSVSEGVEGLVPPPLAAGDLPREQRPPPEVTAVPRFVRPLESPEGENRVREAFVLEDDPENLPATRPLDDPAGSPGTAGESRFQKLAEDAVRRTDLSSRDREVVRSYFESLEKSAGSGREKGGR